MTPDDDLFADALDLPAADRAAWLDRACEGDPAQRARIDALLAGHARAGDFLAVMSVARAPSLPEEKPGDVIGHYTLLKKIGEGGFGSVYLAEQKLPVRRRVALKIIKLGMDTRAVITRFEGERQALAMMDHPDIARVFDAGATDTGRPFFVMEYVDGVPITKFCDEHQLSLAARLELFAEVCLALQHAHQKGIIHRDIKPSNILVASHDGVPTPKVIDFGIAKATQDRITDQTLVTGVDQFMGTPAYMSPEQAERRDLDIDTRSDIYALGVLLYELLSGRLPFDPKSLANVGVDEIRRRIREVEPPRPSARVATLASADRATIARLRGAGPLQLSSTLRGDLDWIVMRCLEKDRDRRYGTAQELAEDIRRHLRQEPVEARPPSTLYRTERFVARHRFACLSVAAIALTLIVGTVVSVRQAIRAMRAERTANAERDAATLARTDAQRRQEDAEGLLTFMLGDFRTELQKIGRLQLLDTVGEKAMAYFATLNPRDLTDTALARQAKALTQIGETRMAEARYADALAAFKTAFDRAAALAARHPQDGDMLFARAQAEYWIGHVAWLRGDAVTRLEWWTHYRDSAVALVALEGKKPRAQLELAYGHHNLAIADSDRGNLTRAKAGFLAERALLETLVGAKPDDVQLRECLADNTSWLGSVAERNGDYPDALRYFSETSARFRDLIALEPAVAFWKEKLALNLIFAAGVETLLGQRADASADYTRARTLLDSLVALDPKNRMWRLEAMDAQLQEAVLFLASGDTASATTHIADVRENLEPLFKLEPSSLLFAFRLAMALRLESRIHLAARLPGANEPVDRAIEMGESLVKASPTNDAVAAELANAYLLAGQIAQAEGRFEAARHHWNHARETLAPRLVGSNYWRLLDPAAQALVLLGQPDQARALIDRLHHFGYHPIDPFAASILEAASAPVSSTQPH